MEPHLEPTSEEMGRGLETLEGEALTFLPFPSSSEEPPSEEGQDTPIYTEFDEDFEEPASPIGQCVAIYHFEGGPST